MNPLAIGKSYLLRLPDGQTLGQVRIQRLEDEWAEGPFRPSAAFAEVRNLFTEEAQLRNEQIIPLWESAADRIEALRIQVIDECVEVHPHLRIFVEGNEAFLALPLKTS